MTRYTPLWEQAGTYAAGVDRRLLAALWPGPACTGCAVTVVSGTMTLNIAPGAVAVPTSNNTGSTLCVTDATEQVVIAAAPTTAGQSRLDIVTCHPRATDIDGGANNDWIFDIVQGTPAASPVAPAVPAGQVPICQVTVAYNVVALVAGNLADRRTGLGLQAGAGPYCHVWQANGQALGNAADTVINFDTVEAGSGYDLTNHWYLVPVAGRYLVTATVGVTSSAMTYGFAEVFLNGTVVKRGMKANWTSITNPCAAVSAAIPCAAGDHLAAGAAVAPAVTSQGSQTQTYAQFTYLGP